MWNIHDVYRDSAVGRTAVRIKRYFKWDGYDIEKETIEKELRDIQFDASKLQDELLKWEYKAELGENAFIRMVSLSSSGFSAIAICIAMLPSDAIRWQLRLGTIIGVLFMVLLIFVSEFSETETKRARLKLQCISNCLNALEQNKVKKGKKNRR